MRYILIFLILLNGLGGGTRAVEQADAAREKVRKIAERAAAATVGIYSRVGEFDRYYGSGFLVTPDGYILTSTTVVPVNTAAVEVYFADHSRRAAEIVETRPEVEAVLLKVARAGMAFLPVNVRMPLPGEPAYTSGNANNMMKLGDGASFSAGVVSSVYQIDNADAQSGYQGLAIETDCAVNPGQDGGPLIDGQGCVLGIVSRGFSVRRWQGTAIPLAEIMPRLRAFSARRVTLDREPVVADKPDRWWCVLAAKYRPALVSLQVKRRYGAEKITRRNWDEFRAAYPGWEMLDATERRRVTADFFAVDSVLAANQMVRRPEGAVTGVLVSPQGHIATSAFNVQGDDRVFVDADQERALPPPGGNLTDLAAAGVKAEFTVANPVYSIVATLHDGRSANATLVSMHPATGIAILQIPLTASISYLDLSMAGPVRTGEEVALLGTAPWSVNTGIVSSTAQTESGIFQFDALLNYANSGGVILSREGRFLGIAGAPLYPQPVSGRFLPFAPPLPNEPSLADFTHCPNSGVGMAVHARRVAALVPSGEGR